MVSKKILAQIKELYESHIPANDIAEQFDLTIEEVENILDSIDEESMKSEDDEEKKKTKDVEERMDSGAESTITGEVVKRTKGLALDIQKTKEEIGDYIYHLFDNTGMPPEKIVAFVETSIGFFIDNYAKVEDLEAELDTSEDIIEKLWELADDKQSKERVVKEYITRCAIEGTPVDKEFVQSMLVEN